MEIIKWSLVIITVLVFIIVSIPVYAQVEESELQKQAGGIIETLFGWIYETSDEMMEQVNIPDNPLNFTEEEADQIYDQGKKTTDSGVDFLRQLHHLSGDIARGALPFPVSADIIFLLGVLVIGLILAFRHRRTVKDLGYLVIGIVILAVILTILTLNLN